MTKHRKWLAELQATKDRLEEEFLNELDQKQQAKEKFRKQEKALRDSSRNILHGADAKDEASKSPDSKPKKSKKKPAWAKPEKKDETEDELAELVGGMENDEELGDLLDFAQNLDYEKYMNDMEIKTMMAQVKKRISDLENNINQDEKRSNDMEVERARREIMALKVFISLYLYTQHIFIIVLFYILGIIERSSV